MIGGIYFGQGEFGGTTDLVPTTSNVVSVWAHAGKTVNVPVMSDRVLAFTPANSRTVGFTTMDDKALTFALKAQTKTLTFSRN